VEQVNPCRALQRGSPNLHGLCCVLDFQHILPYPVEPDVNKVGKFIYYFGMVIIVVTFAFIILSTGRDAVVAIIQHDYEKAILPALLFGIAVALTGWSIGNVKRS
jgi:hypothetical protein